MPPVRVRGLPPGDGWIYEPKLDGFRALAYIEPGAARLVSRNANAFRRWKWLAGAIAGQLPFGTRAVLDGKIVCLDGRGEPDFNRLFLRRCDPCFYAFDLLWLNGHDLRSLPLFKRKRRLERLIGLRPGWVMFVPAFEDGAHLYRSVCDADMEGIVAKRADGIYVSDCESTKWIKIKNPDYSQTEGRHEVFERTNSRSADCPHLNLWPTSRSQ